MFSWWLLLSSTDINPISALCWWFKTSLISVQCVGKATSSDVTSRMIASNRSIAPCCDGVWTTDIADIGPISSIIIRSTQPYSLIQPCILTSSSLCWSPVISGWSHHSVKSATLTELSLICVLKTSESDQWERGKWQQSGDSGVENWN